MEQIKIIKKSTVKTVILAMLALLGAFIFAGCTSRSGGTAPVYYSYNVKNIDHCGFFYVSKTSYFGNRVEFEVNSRYAPEELNYSTPDDANASVDVKKNTVILYSDHPYDISSLNVSTSWFEISFRYLDTSEYACIWRTWADDLGWENYEGDTDKYYTEEEKEQQREAAERAKELREQAEKEDKELFAVFQGKWVSDDGDYFDIYGDDSVHSVKYYKNDTQAEDVYDGFGFSKTEQENGYRMTYQEGGWGLYITYDIEYSGRNSFLYAGKEFRKFDEVAEQQKSLRTREYFENLDKESSLEEIVEEIGPYGIDGSGILYHVWHLNDGTKAKIVFNSGGKIVRIYIVGNDNDDDDSNDDSELIYKREF